MAENDRCRAEMEQGLFKLLELDNEYDRLLKEHHKEELEMEQDAQKIIDQQDHLVALCQKGLDCFS